MSIEKSCVIVMEKSITGENPAKMHVKNTIQYTDKPTERAAGALPGHDGACGGYEADHQGSGGKVKKRLLQ